MLGQAMYTTIKTLWDRNLNKAQISRATGHCWETISKVIKAIESGKSVPEKKSHPRILDPYKDQIIAWIEQELSAVRMHEELLRQGVKIGYTTIKDMVANIKRNNNIFIRVHIELDYYEKVYDQKVETFILCHIHAFQFFGGVPGSVKIDNLKAAILEANFYEPVYQRVYQRFAAHCGFQSIPCRIIAPSGSLNPFLLE